MKWLHNLLKGASLTTALFVFQACYGTPDALSDERGMAPMTFSLCSSATGEPLRGIQISSNSFSGTNQLEEIGVTGEDGTCHVDIPYFRNIQGPYIHFQDPQGLFQPKDTVLFDLREREIVIKLNEVQ